MRASEGVGCDPSSALKSFHTGLCSKQDAIAKCPSALLHAGTGTEWGPHERQEGGPGGAAEADGSSLCRAGQVCGQAGSAPGLVLLHHQAWKCPQKAQVLQLWRPLISRLGNPSKRAQLQLWHPLPRLNSTPKRLQVWQFSTIRLGSTPKEPSKLVLGVLQILRVSLSGALLQCSACRIAVCSVAPNREAMWTLQEHKVLGVMKSAGAQHLHALLHRGIECCQGLHR